jgi:plasmid stabilization system protein ParE
VNYSPRALANLERLEEAAPGASELIEGAVSVLDEHPLIGRAVEAGLRELVISRGKTGCLALYDYDEVHDEVTVLSVRHQREVDYEE